MFLDEQLKKYDIETLRGWLRRKVDNYKVAITYINKSNVVFRGVRCELRPDKISRISYPPPEAIKTLGRLNREGQSRFYCSPAPPAVFFELHAKSGDFIALSEWEVIEPLWMHNLGFHSQTLRQLGAQERSISNRQQLTNPISNETEKNKKIRHELSRAFTSDVPAGKEYKYKQSIAISELFLVLPASPLPQMPEGPRHDKAAGIVYPALKLRGDADNLALLPEFVESSLKIKSVKYVKVEAVNEALSSYSVLAIAKAHGFSGDNIEWQEAVEPEEARRSQIALENGVWVHRDGYNRIYAIR